MSVNKKEIPILVKYYTKSRILYQQEFGSYSTFGDLLNFFNENLKNNEIQLKKKYFINNKEIKNSDLLINIIQQADISSKIISTNFLIEVEEITNFGDENIPCFKKILQPSSRDKFGLYVFLPEKGVISLEEYPENIENKYELKKFSINSAYCNSPNSLFISGGKFNEAKINNFWIINKEFYSIQKVNMIFPKSNHSMLYNNNNNEIIFIAGGDDLKTFYYDIKNNIFVEWGDMNGCHFRPGLISIGDYLFCIHLLKDENNNIFFEKTNLNDKSHLWEKVYPNFETEDIINNIIKNEFGVSHCEGGNIMLIGGSLNNPNSYYYNINMNLISINNNYKNLFIPLIDKTFYKINETHNIALPYNLSKYVEIAIFNNRKYTLRKIHLKSIGGNTIIKYKNYLKHDLNVGKVMIEFKTEEYNKEYDISKIIKNNKIIPNEKPLINNSYNKTNNKHLDIINNSYNQNNKIEINKNKSNINKENNNENKNNLKNNNISENELLSKEKIINNINDELDSKNLDNKNISVNFGIDNDEGNVEKKNNENIKDLKISNNIQYDNNNDHIGNANNVFNKNEKSDDYIIQAKNKLENINKGLYIKNEEEEKIKNVVNNPNADDNEQNINNSEENYEDAEAINENMMVSNEEFEELNDEDIEEFKENNMGEGMELNGEENEGLENGEGNEDIELNGEENESEENDGPIERDRFEMTITQNIGEDIIQIENYPEFYHEENIFCDYDLRQDE